MTSRTSHRNRPRGNLALDSAKKGSRTDPLSRRLIRVDPCHEIGCHRVRQLAQPPSQAERNLLFPSAIAFAGHNRGNDMTSRQLYLPAFLGFRVPWHSLSQAKAKPDPIMGQAATRRPRKTRAPPSAQNKTRAVRCRRRRTQAPKAQVPLGRRRRRAMRSRPEAR
jgi:hypothetical protein